MPKPVTLLLIRPRPASELLLRAIEDAIGEPVAALIAPIMEIKAVQFDVELAENVALIVTSANATRFGPDMAGRIAHVVGTHTAEAVEQAGGKVAFVAPNADALVRHLSGQRPSVPLVWLRGRHVAGDLPARLAMQGVQVTEVVVYDQVACPPDPTLVKAVEGEARAILPLYSPRSAALVGAGIARVGRGLHVISISSAVAKAWRRETGGDSEICDAPKGSEMQRRIIAALQQGFA